MFFKNDSERETISDMRMLENSSAADLHFKKNILKKFPQREIVLERNLDIPKIIEY